MEIPNKCCGNSFEHALDKKCCRINRYQGSDVLSWLTKQRRNRYMFVSVVVLVVSILGTCISLGIRWKVRVCEHNGCLYWQLENANNFITRSGFFSNEVDRDTNTRRVLKSSSSPSTFSRSLSSTLTKYGSYRLLETVPHDSSSYTEGLSMLNMKNDANENISVMIESTGRYGRSALQYVNMTNGNILQRYKLSSQFFGEGITPYDYYPTPNTQHKRIIQITYQEQRAFVYDVFSNFSIHHNPALLFSPSPVLSFTYRTSTNEGWGITYRPDTHVMYVSDGSSYIQTWNASTFQQLGRKLIKKRIRGPFGLFTYTFPVSMLNELEWDPISKTILANVFYTNCIVRIDPETGHVLTIYRLRSLYWPRAITANVLNGIALTTNFETDANNEIWVTGKLWPFMYRIQLID